MKSLYDFISEPAREPAKPVAGNLAGNPNLLRAKQVLRDLRDLLATDSEQVTEGPKRPIGFRLLPATTSEQVPSRSKQVNGGRARAARLSPERLREIALMGVAARRKKRVE